MQDEKTTGENETSRDAIIAAVIMGTSVRRKMGAVMEDSVINSFGERILEYEIGHNVIVFRKGNSHLISFYSGRAYAQIDFVL